MSRGWEAALGAAVAAVGVLMLWVIIPREVKVIASETGEISPAFFPRIVGWAFIVLGPAHALACLIGSGTAGGTAGSHAETGPDRSGVLRALAAFAIGIGYLVLLPGIGFLPATAVAMTGLILFLGEGRLWRAALVALPFAWCVERVFSDLLKTPLPRAGWLE